jgi:hypothetical protein
MSSLRILNIPQDENAGAEVLRGQIGKPVQALQFSKGDGLLKPAFGPRKALGNITNKGSELSGLGKSTVKRRPLGDLTNSLKSANKQGAQQKGTATKPNASNLLPSSSLTAPALTSQLDAALEPLELQWARDGVEKSAGRSWEQQEQLRQQQEDDEIASKLRMVADAVPKFSLPFYQVRLAPCTPCMHAVLLPAAEHAMHPSA